MDAIDNLSPDRPLLYVGMIIELPPEKFIVYEQAKTDRGYRICLLDTDSPENLDDFVSSRQIFSTSNRFAVLEERPYVLEEPPYNVKLGEAMVAKGIESFFEGDSALDVIILSPIDDPEAKILLPLGTKLPANIKFLTGVGQGSRLAAVGYMENGQPVITHEAEWNQDGTLAVLKAKTPSTGAFLPRAVALDHDRPLCLV